MLSLAFGSGLQPPFPNPLPTLAHRICSEPLQHLDASGYCTACPSAVFPALAMAAFLFVTCALATSLYFLLYLPPKRLKRISAVGNMVVRGLITLGPSKIKVRTFSSVSASR